MEKINTQKVELFLQKFLPKSTDNVFVTLTWAQSLDGRIAAAPNERTRLSGLYSKKMTHYLRSKHDAILVGCITVFADNPRLNCRYSAVASSPTPVVLDPNAKWDVSSWEQWAVLVSAKQQETKGPLVFVNENTTIPPTHESALKSCNGQYVTVSDTRNWPEVYQKLKSLGINSVMVEGGAKVIDSCYRNGVDSVIVTIAPVFLGKNGVDAALSAPSELIDVEWWAEEGVDSVVAGRQAN